MISLVGPFLKCADNYSKEAGSSLKPALNRAYVLSCPKNDQKGMGHVVWFFSRPLSLAMNFNKEPLQKVGHNSPRK